MFNEDILHQEILNYLNLKLLLKDLTLIIKHMIISSFHYPIILLVVILLLLFSPKIKNIRDYFFYSIFFFKFIIYYLNLFANKYEFRKFTTSYN